MITEIRKLNIICVACFMLLGGIACHSEHDTKLSGSAKRSVEAQRRAHELGKPELAALFDAMKAVEPLHTPMGAPKEYDWLASNDEPGQTFAEYLGSDPVLPRGARRTLYVQPLGDFTDAQRRIVALTAEYMERFFGLPVNLESEIPFPKIPSNARRTLPGYIVTDERTKNEKRIKEKQILAGYVLNEILRPRLPEDAAALIAFTAADLYPEESWYYVFGQASLRNRVGVWSLHRFGDPAAGAEEFQKCLRRTMKLATHETGHMFSIRHCTKYECNMSGTNHLAETDRRPLDYCPECMAKICWATGSDPRERYTKLADFCQTHGLTEDLRFFQSAIKALDNLDRK